MGILNVTPDSFADGGANIDPDRAARAAQRMVDDGADIVDLGGESTRPGAEPVSTAEELARVVPVLERLRGKLSVPLSIDTYKAEVAERALALGATMVNDISGLTYDPPLARVIARHGASVVLMHTRGRPADMYAGAEYDDVVADVKRELAERADAARAAGIARDRIILDPGLGFAKRAEHTLTLLAGFADLATLGYPLLAGPSRKSFLRTALGDVPPAQRVWGTAAAVTAAILAGASIVRVHDVPEMVQVARTADAIRRAAVARAN